MRVFEEGELEKLRREMVYLENGVCITTNQEQGYNQALDDILKISKEVSETELAIKLEALRTQYYGVDYGRQITLGKFQAKAIMGELK